jgi:DNA-binding beta-propeller fold protein YncE
MGFAIPARPGEPPEEFSALITPTDASQRGGVFSARPRKESAQMPERKRLLSLMAIGLFSLPGAGEAAPSLAVALVIPLPHVKGGFDLMAADVPGQRLFVAAEDNNTVEVIDLAAGKHLRSISGFIEPKWVVYRPEAQRLYVSCGGDGSVRVLESRTFGEIKRFEFKEKANNLRYDAKTKELFVGVGNTFGAIGIIDTARDAVAGQVTLASFPKQFEVAGNCIYVNVPEANHIAVVDRRKMTVVERWPVTEAKGNVPMGADPGHERLFIGCEPGKLVVFETGSGKAVASVDINPEPDSIYYDTKRKRIYISCGEGSIDVVARTGGEKYKLMDRIATAKGAATSLFIPEFDRLCLAVPQRGRDSAEIRLYEVGH